VSAGALARIEREARTAIDQLAHSLRITLKNLRAGAPAFPVIRGTSPGGFRSVKIYARSFFPNIDRGYCL
jgi:CHAD domain-containing protein